MQTALVLDLPERVEHDLGRRRPATRVGVHRPANQLLQRLRGVRTQRVGELPCVARGLVPRERGAHQGGNALEVVAPAASAVTRPDTVRRPPASPGPPPGGVGHLCHLHAGEHRAGHVALLAEVVHVTKQDRGRVDTPMGHVPVQHRQCSGQLHSEREHLLKAEPWNR